ncbi:glutamyl-tRNA reductase [Natrialbaceae archaeon AArc-T1-2]|uniref:glutamyl-tRNA reductase n=1 Tax=Natrialbaceae archaeon AArc-T1-2 TaxID=3053904 RepID=UPI00255A766E|nr:glutamyl-tRNA reductase [Natrialbaceae archaeon AArc-T1-2]WIV68005.1 glutamyl-tRNA reductase [Natrialbaceae archaeon AArc-T1-2]
MTDAGVVSGARVTHETGSVDELAAASPDSQRAGVAELYSRSDVEEAFVISTCNRVEAYVVTPDAETGRELLADVFGDVPAETVVYTDHDESLRHLLRVATGLESVVLGEDQIIGQVRDAYEDARTVGAVGPMLETAITKAIHVGERARTETSINEGVVSLGSAATKLIAETAGLEDATTLVVGAGEMGELAARSLADRDVEAVVVANRTVSAAEDLVTALEDDADARAVSLADLESVASRADAVVTATGSPEPILEPAHLGECEQVVVDLGQPRDVRPTADSLDNVTVYDLDDLEAVTERTRCQRADAAAEVEAMIDREFDLLCEQYKRMRADEVIAAMYESADRIKRRELETACSRLEAAETAAEREEVVRSMADALVSQLLAPPTKSLREAAAEDDWETISTALQLFDPEFGPESIVGGDGSPDGTEAVGALEDD